MRIGSARSTLPRSGNPLGDRLGIIPDAFNDPCDTVCGEHLAQVVGHWRPPRDKIDDMLADPRFKRVDVPIVLDHARRQLAVALDKGEPGIVERDLGPAAHLGDQAAQLAQIMVECRSGMPITVAAGNFAHCLFHSGRSTEPSGYIIPCPLQTGVGEKFRRESALGHAAQDMNPV
jgi:hypothetical protein